MIDQNLYWHDWIMSFSIFLELVDVESKKKEINKKTLLTHHLGEVHLTLFNPGGRKKTFMYVCITFMFMTWPVFRKVGVVAVEGAVTRHSAEQSW